jgi:excisionase family DNA binding protein
MMRIDEFAEMMRISRRTVYRLIAAGVIRPYRLGRRILFGDEHVAALIAYMKQSPTKKARS